jgi:hypothetical protein
MNTPTRNTLFLFALLALISLSTGLSAGTVAAAKLTAALDSPAGVTFSQCTNASVISSYSSSNIGNSEETAAGKVLPVSGNSFLQMDGSSSPKAKGRSGRVLSSFSLTFQGAGTLSFQQRVNTYGYNDDLLIVYEDDIDDTLWEQGGDNWAKVYVDEDKEKWFDINVDGFFNEESVSLSTQKYKHTLTFALLAPDSSDIDYYDPPDSETKSEYELLYKAWLDAFVWEPDEDAAICQFQPESGTSFGANGIQVYLNSDYVDDNDQRIFTFRYTLDGKVPSASSPLYNDEEGISIQKSCRLRVAIYEGSTLVNNDLYADYVLRDAPQAPTCTLSQGLPFYGTATASFSAVSEAPALEFYYTTDGSEPGVDSPKGSNYVLSEECPLKVRAYDDGTWGSTAVFPVKRAAAPVATILADGEESKGGIFIEKAELNLSSSTKGGIYYRLGDGAAQSYSAPLEFSEDATVKFLLKPAESKNALTSGTTLYLESAPASAKVRKAQKDDGTWITSQLTNKGWNLVAIPRALPPSMEKALSQWLKPYGFQTTTKQYLQPSRMEQGNSYWVYLSNESLPTAGKPEVFYSVEGDSTDADAGATSTWRLVLKNALYYLENGIFRKADSPENEHSGWTRD